MSVPGRRMDSPKRSGMDALRLDRVSIGRGFPLAASLSGEGSLVVRLCRALGSHPFVPAGLTPVAQNIILRPPCPIRHTVQTKVSRVLLRANGGRAGARIRFVYFLFLRCFFIVCFRQACKTSEKVAVWLGEWSISGRDLLAG